VMRVAGDAQRTLAPDLLEDLLGCLIRADVLPDVQGDDVGVLLAAQMILCDLGAWNDEQIVELSRARGLGGDVVHVRVEAIRGHGIVPQAE